MVGIGDGFCPCAASACSGGSQRDIAERAVYELPYLAPAQMRLAGIARANGDLDAAKLHAARAEELWRDADAAVRVAFR